MSLRTRHNSVDFIHYTKWKIRRNAAFYYLYNSNITDKEYDLAQTVRQHLFYDG